MVAALVVGVVFLLGMVVATWYAARTLPRGARVPLNAGVPEYSVWLSKPAGLAAWLAIGVVAFAAFASLTMSSIVAGWASSMRVVLLPCVMMVVLAAEAGAVISARKRCAVGAPGQAAPEPAAPEDAAPEDAAPEDAAPEDAAPEDAAPETPEAFETPEVFRAAESVTPEPAEEAGPGPERQDSAPPEREAEPAEAE